MNVFIVTPQFQKPNDLGFVLLAEDTRSSQILLGFSYLLSLMCLSPVCSPTTQGLLQLLSEGGGGWRPCLGDRF